MYKMISYLLFVIVYDAKVILFSKKQEFDEKNLCFFSLYSKYGLFCGIYIHDL